MNLKFLQQHESEGRIYQNDVQEKCEQDNQSKPEIAEGRNFVYLVMFIKLVFGQINIVCFGILSLLIVKTECEIAMP